MEQAAAIQTIDKVTAEQFRNEIVPAAEPVVFNGLVNEWPLVEAAAQSAEAAARHIMGFDNHKPVYTIVGEPQMAGRFFYSDDLQGVNFQRIEAAVTAILEQLLALRGNPNPHAVAIQAATVSEVLPGFVEQHRMPLLDDSIGPTMWLGNKALVAPHYDVYENIACVGCGQRRFTLFPPEQVANLYPGPSLNAPGGVPISLVDLRNPDLEKFPAFAEAMQNARTATLSPGDAIFIPTPWWHAVESLNDVNVLINYWWGGGDLPGVLSPNNSLMHSMLTVAKLSPAQRESWRHLFDYFVFQNKGDPTAHLPEGLYDIITEMTDEQRQSVYEFLKSRLK